MKYLKKNDPIKQLEASKSSIKELLSDLLNETKSFQYQITLKVTLKNTKPMEKLNLDQFILIKKNPPKNPKKAVINLKFSLENAFQEILYRTDNWINEGSSWIVELIESQYINVSTYRPLSGSSYIKLPAGLRSLKKD